MLDWLKSDPISKAEGFAVRASNIAGRTSPGTSPRDMDHVKRNLNSIGSFKRKLERLTEKKFGWFSSLDRAAAGDLRRNIRELGTSVDSARSICDGIRSELRKGFRRSELDERFNELTTSLDSIKGCLKRIRELLERLRSVDEAARAVKAQQEKEAREEEEAKRKRQVGAKRAKDKKEPVQEKCLDVDPERIYHTDEYVGLVKGRFRQYKNRITEKENSIISLPCSHSLHGPIRHGRYAGHLHAYLTDNIRIIYLYDGSKKELTYVTIMTKNELDQT